MEPRQAAMTIANPKGMANEELLRNQLGQWTSSQGTVGWVQCEPHLSPPPMFGHHIPKN